MTRSLNYFLLLLLLLFTPAFLSAQSGDGILAGSFLRMGLGARALGMGGAFTAVADGPTSGYYNPGGAPFIQKREIMASYRFLSLDRHFNYIGFAQNISPKIEEDSDDKAFNGGLILSWIYAGTDNIDGRGYNGQHTADFSNGEHALSLTFGISPLEFIGIGITGKYLYNRFPKVKEDESALTEKSLGIDLGILIRPLDFLSFGFMIKDMNAKYDWKTDELYEKDIDKIDYFPKTYRGGIAVTYPYSWLTFALDVEKNEEQDEKIHIGLEAIPAPKFAVRVGLNDGNFAGGLGYNFSMFKRSSQILYAIVTKDYDVASEHVFSWIFEF